MGLQQAPPLHTHVHAHTYSSSPFTTSTQRDSVREVAEADLGQNQREVLRDGPVGIQTAFVHSLHFARNQEAHNFYSME